MNIFRRELKASLKGLIIWSICLFLLVLSGMSKYSAYSSGGESSDVFDSLPQTMKALLGLNSFDITQIGGFFAMLFLYIELAAAIHAVLLGSGMIAKEERNKTVEFLMAKPVSRGTVLTAKLLAALVQVILLNLVTLAASLVMVSIYEKGKGIWGEVQLFMASLLLVQLIFLALGTTFAALLKRPNASGVIVTGVLLGSFVISKITDLANQLNPLNVLSPFKYFSYERILNGEGLHAGIVALSLLLAGVLVVVTYTAYCKRELQI